MIWSIIKKTFPMSKNGREVKTFGRGKNAEKVKKYWGSQRIARRSTNVGEVKKLWNNS